MRYIIVLLFFFVPAIALAQDTPIPLKKPEQPSFQDQLYMIARAQDKQVDILQQQLDEVHKEVERWKEYSRPLWEKKK
jgi:hypothetical protein